MVTVQDLLLEPFSRRTRYEKVDIVSAGRPTPKLLWALFRDASTSGVMDIYSRIPWITACEQSKAFYCWPCLLLGAEVTEWNTAGLKNLQRFNEDVLSHKNDVSHLHSMLQYQMFRHQYCQSGKEALDAENGEGAEGHHEPEKRIADAVVFLVSQMCRTMKSTGTCSPLDVSHVVRTLDFLGAHEVSTTACLAATRILQADQTVLNDVILAIVLSLEDVIKEEVRKTSYVSLVLSEHNEGMHHSKISAVLRYTKDGLVCERFLGFFQISQYKTADVIHQFVRKVIEEYGASEKFVAYSLDGAVLASPSHVGPLQAKLRDDYPFAYFVPCHAHDLNAVLEQRLSNLKEVRRFFGHLRAVKGFFRDRDSACNILEGFLGFNTIRGLARAEWCDTSFLMFLSSLRPQFVKFFESVRMNPAFWEAGDLPKALAFQQVLQEFETVFVLQTVVKLFKQTSSLRETLQSPSFESAVGSNLVAALKADLDRGRHSESFESHWESVVSDLTGGETTDNNLSAPNPDSKMLFREFYLKIHDLLLEEVSQRLDSLPELAFFHLFDPAMYEKSTVRVTRGGDGSTTCFSETPLENLLSVLGPSFETTWVENELKVFFKNSCEFPSLSVYDLLDFFGTADLRGTFRNLTRIAELILTMPCKPPSAGDGASSKLKEVNKWASVWGSKEFSCGLAFLCVEERFLDQLQDDQGFLENVMRMLVDGVDCRSSVPRVIVEVETYEVAGSKFVKRDGKEDLASIV